MQESEQTYRIKSYLLLFVHLQSKCYRRPIFFSFHLFLLDCWTKRPNKNNIFTSLFVLRKIWLFIIYQRFSNLSLLLPLHPTHHVHIESCNNTIFLEVSGICHLSWERKKIYSLMFVKVLHNRKILLICLHGSLCFIPLLKFIKI